MNFMKYPTKNDISISNAVLKLANLQNAERLELTAATGAVIVTSGRMTAKELLSTVQSLTGRAAELMTLLRLTCGDCTNCSEECAYRDRSITELIRPAVVVPDWARQDAGLAGDAKLDCYVDEDTHELSHLTETQRRRLWKYCVEGKSVRLIAKEECAYRNAVWKSIQAAKEKMFNFFVETGCAKRRFRRDR